ncbi:hypothetical protein HWV62_24241 [Athelia sp. TMB]|nr:hypothetical protein HWV62_24241 [Athelia sp. TMB]
MDTSAPKHAHTSFSTPAPRSPFRRRRIIWALLTVFAVVFFFGAPWELPARGLGSSVSRANIAQLVKQKQWQPEEVYGLLHMVTNAEMEGQVLSHDSATDPRKPMELSVYNAGKEGNWRKYVAELEENYPVVVFSKTYCPHSRKAKALLETYDLVPAPKIVEADIREDGDLLKLLLHRLTGRATFPNTIVHGKTIGGSDDLQSLHAQGLLKGIFEAAGVKVLGDVPGPSS